MKTYITYNKGRDWRLLQAPDVDLRGSPVHCLLVSYPVSCEVHRADWLPGDAASGAFFHPGVLGSIYYQQIDFIFSFQWEDNLIKILEASKHEYQSQRCQLQAV